jgi:hypothetical protein
MGCLLFGNPRVLTVQHKEINVKLFDCTEREIGFIEREIQQIILAVLLCHFHP